MYLGWVREFIRLSGVLFFDAALSFLTRLVDMRFVRVPILAVIALCLSAMCIGCVGPSAQESKMPSRKPEIAGGIAPSGATRPVETDPMPLASPRPLELDRNATGATESLDNNVKLESLWNARMANGSGGSPETFTLGPGDLLMISVPFIEQLKNRRYGSPRVAQVSADDRGC